jgi:gluconolactonase
MANIRVLATDLEFPEGPVVMPDGSVVLVEIRGRRLTRVYPDGRKEVVAEIPGGPNGAALSGRTARSMSATMAVLAGCPRAAP